MMAKKTSAAMTIPAMAPPLRPFTLVIPAEDEMMMPPSCTATSRTCVMSKPRKPQTRRIVICVLGLVSDQINNPLVPFQGGVTKEITNITVTDFVTTPFLIELQYWNTSGGETI